MAEIPERRNPISREAHERMMQQVAKMTALEMLNSFSPHDLTTKDGAEAERMDRRFTYETRSRCEKIRENAIMSSLKYGAIGLLIFIIVYLGPDIAKAVKGQLGL